MPDDTPAPISDIDAMQLAIAASRQALAAGNMPFGASLVSADGRLLHVAGNDQVTSGDFSGHAEMVLLREASTRLGRDALRGTTVLASGEPCAMCSGALFWAGVRRLVFAATTGEIAECLGGPVLTIGCREVLDAAQPALIVEGPLLGPEAVAVLRQAAA